MAAVIQYSPGKHSKKISYCPAVLHIILFLCTTNPACVASLNMLLPLYAPPDQNWVNFAKIIKANSKIQFTIIVNVNNGPGNVKSALYASGIQRFASLSNARVLGYIDTSNGDCFSWAKASAACSGPNGPSKVSDVLSQMKKWISYYGIGGFFLDNFLPYSGLASKSLPAVASVLSVSYILQNTCPSISPLTQDSASFPPSQDYSSIYKNAKANFPSSIVAGNPSSVSPTFKSVGLKLADMIVSNLPASTYLSNGDTTLSHVPQAYAKALVADKLSASPATAKQQISSLVAAAKVRGAQFFGAVRQESVFPIDTISYQVQKLA